MIKPTIVVGETPDGKLELLYLGEDADPAKDILDNPPSGFAAVTAYRRPDPWKRKKFNVEPVAAPAPEAPLVPESGTPAPASDVVPDPLADLANGAVPEPPAPAAASAPAPKRKKN